MCAQRRLRSAWASAWRKLRSSATHWAHSEDWSDWADAQADLSLRSAHMPFCWFCHEASHLGLFSDLRFLVIPAQNNRNRKEIKHQRRHQIYSKPSGKPSGQLFSGRWPLGHYKQTEQKVKDKQKPDEQRQLEANTTTEALHHLETVLCEYDFQYYIFTFFLKHCQIWRRFLHIR